MMYIKVKQTINDDLPLIKTGSSTSYGFVLKAKLCSFNTLSFYKQIKTVIRLYISGPNTIRLYIPKCL